MPDDPDSDTELLAQDGGAKMVSYYSKFDDDGEDDEDDDDDDDDFDLIAVSLVRDRKRPRGRPPKSRPLPKKARSKTVFEISDDEDTFRITRVHEKELDAKDKEASLAAQRAREVLAASITENIQQEQAIRKAEEHRVEEEAQRRRIKEQKEIAKRIAPQNKQQQGVVFKARHGDKVKKVRMRTTDPVIKLLPKFCEDFELELNKVYMEFDGEEVGNDDTLASLEIEQDMIVDVFVRGSRR